jgi:hypothetical protein
LDLLPLSTHESPGLLATPSRSGLRPSFPARPICCSAFRLWSASLASPTAWPTTPSADFCAAVGSPLGFPSSETRKTTQTSPGKFDRLRRTPAGCTGTAFDGLWTSRLVTRSSDQGCLISSFCSSGRGFAPHCLQTPPRDDAPRFREGRLVWGSRVSSGFSSCFSRARSRAAGRSPAALRDRARWRPAACRPISILRGFPASCRARRNIRAGERSARYCCRPTLGPWCQASHVRKQGPPMLR